MSSQLPCHFDEMKGIFKIHELWTAQDKKIKNKLDSFINEDKYAAYDGFDLLNDPSGINIPQVLRLRKLWKCYDMKEYAKYRYKIFQQKGHWFPGVMAFDSNIKKIDISKIPDNIPLKEMLKETHNELYTPPQFKLAKN